MISEDQKIYYQEWLAKNKDRRAAVRKQYYFKNKDRILIYHKKYYSNPEVKVARKKYYTNPEVKIHRKLYYARPEINSSKKEYRKLQRATNSKYIERKRKYYAKRKREFDFNPLNNWFPKSHAHHLDKINVIYVPSKINQKISHRQINNDQMKQINIIAWSFMESRVY